jgi:hypothetical protein
LEKSIFTVTVKNPFSLLARLEKLFSYYKRLRSVSQDWEYSGLRGDMKKETMNKN